MSADGERAALLFLERWLEQLRTYFVPRRARTLGAHSSLEELLALAESFVRSGGTTRPSVEPEDGGHGIHMLGDVALEAADFITADEVLKSLYPVRKLVLFDLVSSLRSKENVTQDSVEILRAMIGPLRRGAIDGAFQAVRSIVASSPKEHEAMCSLADSTVSELRARGWSDEALEEAGAATLGALPQGADAALTILRDIVARPRRDYACFVAVTLPEPRPPFPEDDPHFSLVEVLPEAPRVGRPPKSGPYLRAMISAFDPYAAAASAHRQVLSTIGALTVFLPGSPVDVASDLVVVEVDGVLRMVALQERLLAEKRKADREEQARILRSSWNASRGGNPDPLHDALRLRHRALMARDAESRLLLLWSSLERMTAGARGYEAALSAAKELVSHAVTFGKVRRDVGDLLGSIMHGIGKHEGKKQQLHALAGGDSDARATDVDRMKIFELLLGDTTQLRKLTSIVYDVSPLLAYRCHELWRAFGSGIPNDRGKAFAEYYERSRLRVARQVGRIYRARNRIAHAGTSPERVRDLVWHAHFYLTQLVAICVHYSESRPRRAQDILLGRMGQYRAYMRLLQRNDTSATSAQALMRPTTAVGEEP